MGNILEEASREIQSISKYYRSFSGTDTLAFLMLPGCIPICLGAITTISYSIFRNKKPVINIGRTNINGVTRGSRIFAGTMIFTLINQHWLKEVQNEVDWLGNFNELKVDELPLFDIMIVSANEYGSAVSMYIYGIDFTDEGQTISVEDLFTENTFSFIAREVATFKAFDVLKGEHSHSDGRQDVSNGTFTRFHVLDSSETNIEDLVKFEQEFKKAEIQEMQKRMYKTLPRDLYYSTTRMMIGNDVAEIQELLRDAGYDIDVDGTFSSKMDEVVRLYQSDHGFSINGVVDDRLYNSLLNESEPNSKMKFATVMNKSGARVYRKASMDSDDVGTKEFQETVPVYGLVNDENPDIDQKYYITDIGYILEEDLYSSYYTGNIVEFPILKYGSTGSYVTLAQAALSKIYPGSKLTPGEFDLAMQALIKNLQKNNGLNETGEINDDTWQVLQHLSGYINKISAKDNFKIDFSQPPGTYNLSKDGLLNEIPGFNATLSCDSFINVRVTATSKYKEGNQEVMSKVIQVKDSTKISLEDFESSFFYHPKYGNPESVDFIIYPYNKDGYKWTFSA